MTAPALRVTGLIKRYRRGWFQRTGPPAVDGVDLEVEPGEVVGLIGESGSGKTTLARVALGLLPYDAGQVSVLGQDWRALSRAGRRGLRRRAQLLFQSADASLNPGLRTGQILAESARLHRPGEPVLPVVQAALSAVGLSGREGALPHELSGGEKRRVTLAQCWIANPELLVADEPTAGLDAALKADVLDLLRAPGRAILLISHDLPAVCYLASRAVVLFAGRVIEEFPLSALGSGPHHPYTWSLIDAAGLAKAPAEPGAELPVGRGAPGCPYRGPCPWARPVCATEAPALRVVHGAHRVACHAPEVAP